MFSPFDCKEMDLFTNKIPLEKKKITAEVCIHHLWFTNDDYATKGNLIKWNFCENRKRKALWEALLDNRIDVIATDHCIHLRKNNNLILKLHQEVH
jgi:dihydroorotase